MATNPRVLVAVKNCVKYRHRAEAQRATWATFHPDCDIRFFLGGDPLAPQIRKHPDEVILPVPDDYLSLPLKTKAICRWALQNGYDFLFTCDDDTYVQLDRLLASDFKDHDYVGRLRGPSGGYSAPYCSGFAYWLSIKAMHAVISAGLNGDTADDRFIGQVMEQNGIKGVFDDRYRVTKCDEAKTAGSKGDVAEDRMVGNATRAAGIEPTLDDRYAVIASQRNALSAKEGPREGNNLIAVCEFEPEQMYQVHNNWLNRQSGQAKLVIPPGPLDRVSVLLKTFLRDGFLNCAAKGIQKVMPEVKMIIVDDGFETKHKITYYAGLRQQGHMTLWLPFDSGFGAKANAGSKVLDREYLLIGSDDFNFESPNVRQGVEALVRVLDGNREIGVASGRVNNMPYEGNVTRNGRHIYETRVVPSGRDFDVCDLTVNYCLVRKTLFDQGLHWCPEWKIGGDHYCWFKMVKDMGWKVAHVPGVNIQTIPDVLSWRLPQYMTMRGRAIKSLPSMFKFMDFDTYTQFDGTRTQMNWPEGICTITNTRHQIIKQFNFLDSDLVCSCSRCGGFK
jgi:hypothetical protein